MIKDNGPRNSSSHYSAFQQKARPARENNASPSVSGRVVNARSTSKPPPALPPELWELILSILGKLFNQKVPFSSTPMGIDWRTLPLRNCLSQCPPTLCGRLGRDSWIDSRASRQNHHLVPAGAVARLLGSRA